MPSEPVRLRWNDPLAVDLTAAVQRGDAARLGRMLARRPELARARVVKDGESAGSRTACGSSSQEVAELLLASGADINWVGWGGMTPLDQARRAEADALAVWLEAHGARSAVGPERGHQGGERGH